MHVEIRHPLLQHKLSLLRDKGTKQKEFRELSSEITMLLTYEAFKDMPLSKKSLETPLTETEGYEIKDDIIIVPILRAGVGMLEGILNLLPNARVGFVGIYRDPDTKQPVEYYEKLPVNPVNPLVVIIDPMLATGGSIIATIALLRKKGFDRIKIISIISAPEGIEAVEKAYADIEIFTGHIDSYLDDHKYIVPGLGDAGDRLFGTK
ncbi:uracil phosphoribosyltransferase [Candidatus Mcinerneyibacteriota bacterium]|nr:uracil phosphoribosyltransferase [Candidatus Mcinerneyibacteriota bacterium]